MYSKKLILSIFSAFALVAFFSVGCKKSNNSSNSSSVTASMGSTSFSSSTSNTVAWYSTDSAVFNIGAAAISGGDTTLLTLSVLPPFTLNTAITNPNAVYIDYYVSTSKDYFAGFGTGHVALTVTTEDTVNHKFDGTFTGTLYNTFNQNDSMLVTNGKFNISYVVVP